MKEQLLLNGSKELVLVTQDESIFRCDEDEQILKPKGEGRGIIFVCPCHGILIPKNAPVILQYGKNYDGYWMERMWLR
jgi:hypothetical protein